MDIDDVFDNYAEFGYYQKTLFLYLVSAQAFLAFHQIHTAFLGSEPVWYCHSADGKVHPKFCSNITIRCISYEFPNTDFTSIVSQYELICDRSIMANYIQSFFMAGIFVGALVFGRVADVYGRRPVVSWCAVGMALCSLMGLLTIGYWWYALARFFTAVFCGGLGVTSFVLLSELLGSHKRGLAGMTVPACFAIGIAMFAGLAYMLRTWQMLTIVTSLPGLLGVILYWELPESPRWYLSQGRVTDAERVLNYMIYRNTGSYKDPRIVLNHPTVSGHKAPKEGIMAILKVPTLRSRTAINVFAWFTNCCVYYGLTLGAGDLGGSRYVSVALSGLVEIPTYLLTACLIETRLGRRLPFVGSQILGSIFCGLLFVIPKDYAMEKVGLALSGKIAVSMSFAIAWLFSAEMYPTSIRNQGVSVCTSAARLGGIISPLLRTMNQSFPGLDYLTFSILCFFSGIFALKLPETHNKPLPENIADLTVSPTKYFTETKVLTEDKIRLLQADIEKHRQSEFAQLQ